MKAKPKDHLEPTFKPATEKNADTLIWLMCELYKYDHTAFDPAAHRIALENLLKSDAYGKVWLIELEQEVIGYVVLVFGYSLEFHGRDAIIDELFIVEKYRRRGIGTRVLLFLEEVCRTNDVRALHLEVEHANTSAQAFYRKVGFTDHHRYLMTRLISD
ncbi:GNAT family N-acetyltransferase [Candidatus Acetothermia bacterium]|nr:GNAT family N-acetyltransferase [Candidatus Acetothermia bacterium]MBI3460716.1 GNAT family N-acetyltransferase [Candidatus Acetothermia bacterium]MBI3660018.1 GNAT family N-acetyltransferase [Candidatus Acetothermia bacterium]